MAISEFFSFTFTPHGWAQRFLASILKILASICSTLPGRKSTSSTITKRDKRETKRAQSNSLPFLARRKRNSKNIEEQFGEPQKNRYYSREETFVVPENMLKRPKTIKHQTQSEKDVLDERSLREVAVDANASKDVSAEPERLEPVETNVRPSRAMLSDVIREIRLEEKEPGLDIWEEADDEPGNEAWWFDMA